MSIPSSLTPLFSTGAGVVGITTTIERSLRFNSADSAYLSRTPAVAGDRTKWTWAGWVKRSKIGNQRFSLFCDETEFFFQQSTGADTLVFYYYPGSYTGFCETLMLFRDTSAWYHIVLALDTTQGTAANRCKIYVNGVQQSTNFTSNFGPSATPHINSTAPHQLGRSPTEALPYDGYLADIHFIDGQALTPSSFTEVSATTGQLIPKTYTGTFGTNGFWLKFSDNSAATAATLGNDYSGNNNDWTPNNLSVTAGAGNDSLVDTPTSYGTDTGVGGEVRGNYATLNPLDNAATLSDGNLKVTSPGASWTAVRGTFGVSSGKWYWESTITQLGFAMIGVANSTNSLTGDFSTNTNNWMYLSLHGNKYGPGIGGGGAAYAATYAVADIISVALNMDAGTITFYKNGSSLGQAFSGLSGIIFPFTGVNSDSSAGITNTNFGQRAFAYTAPSGFKALCDTNIPEGTITTSGTFTGNASADGPFVYLNGVPTAMTINSNSVTFGTHADKLSNGFKVRNSTSTYNIAGSNTFSVSTTGAKFKFSRAQPNP